MVVVVMVVVEVVVEVVVLVVVVVAAIRRFDSNRGRASDTLSMRHSPPNAGLTSDEP